MAEQPLIVKKHCEYFITYQRILRIEDGMQYTNYHMNN